MSEIHTRRPAITEYGCEFPGAKSLGNIPICKVFLKGVKFWIFPCNCTLCKNLLQIQVTFSSIVAIGSVCIDWCLTTISLVQRWPNYGPRATCGQSTAFLWPAKNLYQAKTPRPLFSFSNRLIPYKRIIKI